MHADYGDLASRGRIEVKAEPVAYVVCQGSGLDAAAYSVPFVARWAETTSGPERPMPATGEAVAQRDR